MSNKIIYIDPGHGGRDPGAVNGTRTEADDVLWLSRLIRDKFAAHEVDARLTRDGNYDVSIKERCAMANKANATFFCSIHRNAASASATGNEIWVYSDSKQDAVDRAARILSAICNANGLKNRGVKKGAPQYTDFGVTRDTNMPAMLCEVGFITNAHDNAAYDKTLEAMAESICSAICAEFGITTSPTTKPVPASFTVKEWQKAAMADGYQFPKCGADGMWGSECESVAKKAVCKYHIGAYKLPNLTELVQKAVGTTIDGKFGKNTTAAVVAWQKENGLTADGEVGINTWKKMLGVN